MDSIFTTEILLDELNSGNLAILENTKWSIKIFNMIFSLCLSADGKIAKMGISLIREKFQNDVDILRRISIDVFAKFQVIFSKGKIINSEIIEDSLLLFEELAQFNR